MITEDDDELWNKMTEDVTPIEKQPRQSKRSNVYKTQTKPLSVHTHPSSYPTKRIVGNEMDRNTEKKLNRGHMPIEGRLDLHGMNIDQAQEGLNSFLVQSYNSQKRCVLVITGKGKGILKRYVTEWLEQQPLKTMILRTVVAQPKDGGGGALYVYLRKHRS